MAVFRRRIARATAQAPASLLSGIADAFDPAEIVPIPLANARNEFDEDPLNNAGQVTALSYDPGSGSLIADLDIGDDEVASRLSRGLAGGMQALISKKTGKLRGVGLTLRPSGAPVTLTADPGATVALTEDAGYGVPTEASLAEQEAALEAARIAQDAEPRVYVDRAGRVVREPMIDRGRAVAATVPRSWVPQPRESEEPGPATRREISRLSEAGAALVRQLASRRRR